MAAEVLNKPRPAARGSRVGVTWALGQGWGPKNPDVPVDSGRWTPQGRFRGVLLGTAALVSRIHASRRSRSTHLP